MAQKHEPPWGRGRGPPRRAQYGARRVAGGGGGGEVRGDCARKRRNKIQERIQKIIKQGQKHALNAYCGVPGPYGCSVEKAVKCTAPTSKEYQGVAAGEEKKKKAKKRRE